MLRDARLAYKKEENAAAFRLYCAYLKENAFPKPSDDAEKLAERREKARVRVMCEDLGAEYYFCGENFDVRVLAPFATYADFLTFMEAEFKAQGEPARYAEPTELCRSLAVVLSNDDSGNANPDGLDSDAGAAQTPTETSSK